ncbi:MAG: hypothetical protein AAF267_16850 [Deinococcota bacterium]
MSQITNAEQFFGSFQLEQRDVVTTAGVITVKAMTAGERDKFEAKVAKGATKANASPLASNGLFRATLVAKCVINKETGKRIFGDDQATLTKIALMPSRTINRIYNVAAELSGITESDEAELTESMGKASTLDESGEPQPSEAKLEAN